MSTRALALLTTLLALSHGVPAIPASSQGPKPTIKPRSQKKKRKLQRNRSKK